MLLILCEVVCCVSVSCANVSCANVSCASNRTDHRHATASSHMGHRRFVISGGGKCQKRTNEIYEFIVNDKPFITPPTRTTFKEKYPNQNGGILGEDAYEFAKKYNTNVQFVQDDTMKTNTGDVLLYVLNGSHMIYIHKDEIYNPASF